METSFPDGATDVAMRPVDDDEIAGILSNSAFCDMPSETEEFEIIRLVTTANQTKLIVRGAITGDGILIDFPDPYSNRTPKLKSEVKTAPDAVDISHIFTKILKDFSNQAQRGLAALIITGMGTLGFLELLPF